MPKPDKVLRFWADKKKKRANRSSDWNQLFESDREKMHELVIAYINGGMMAAEAKSQVWLKDKGFSMPKPSTLQRWKNRFVRDEPMRMTQSGPRLKFLAQDGMEETLLRMVEVTRAKGLPVTVRAVRIFVYALYALVKIVLPPGKPTLSWVKWWTRKNGFTKRKGTNAGRKGWTEADQAAHIELMTRKVAFYIEKFNICRGTLFVMDETGVPMWSVGDYTLEKKGAKQVPIAGSDDKKQVTVTLTAAAEGFLGLSQMIWTGKEQSSRALPPKKDLPELFDKLVRMHQTPSHWQTSGSFLCWVEECFLVDLKQCRVKLGLQPDSKCILLIDLYKTHQSPAALSLLKKNHVLPLFIDPSLTGLESPLDILVNSVFMQRVSQHQLETVMRKIGGCAKFGCRMPRTLQYV
jgi:hypothetical protein